MYVTEGRDKVLIKVRMRAKLKAEQIASTLQEKVDGQLFGGQLSSFAPPEEWLDICSLRLLLNRKK